MEKSRFLVAPEVVIKLEKVDDKLIEVYTEVPQCIKQEPELEIKSELPENLEESEKAQTHNKKYELNRKKVQAEKKRDSNCRIPCKICNLTLSSTQSYQYHQNAFHSGKPKPVFKCHLCTRTFPQPNFLKSHLRTHNDKNVFECDICGRKRMDRTKLQRHMEMHRKLTIYQCDLCPKSFKSKNYINRHVVKHLDPTERRRVKCSKCNKFIYAECMRLHMTCHSKNKPYKCDLCPLQFVARNKLNYHRRTHTGEKPFECNLCDRTFVVNSKLKEHIKFFHSDFKLDCKYCGKNYMSMTGINMHYKTVHRNEKDFKEVTKTEKLKEFKGNDSKDANVMVEACDEESKISKARKFDRKAKSRIEK